MRDANTADTVIGTDTNVVGQAWPSVGRPIAWSSGWRCKYWRS